MTMMLAPLVGENFSSVVDPSIFFSKKEIRDMSERYDIRERPPIGIPEKEPVRFSVWNGGMK